MSSVQTHFNNLHTFWGIMDYDEEHHEILLEREKSRFPFLYQSPQFDYRKTLVDWMRNIALLKKLDNSSIHLAVYLLDVFMDNYNIITERLHLVALVCLLLATKFEERDGKILKVHELNDFVSHKYATSDYYSLEVIILKHIKWNLMLPTAVHFVMVYIEFLVSNDDLHHLDSTKLKDFWEDAKSIAHSYLDYVMEDIKLTQAKPSLVAAAIMAVTRSSLKLTPVWPTQLNYITGFKLFELKLIILRLKKKPKGN